MTIGASDQSLDVSRFLQGLKFGRYHLHVLIVCSLVTFFDGLDFAALAYALPYIRDEMSISDDMTGYVSSSAFLGQMIGSIFGSYLADVFGRRPVILACAGSSAIFTILVGFAGTPEQLIALRFVSGLAIGGLLPPVWALSVETMPHSMRMTSVTVIMMGFSFGSASAAPVANWIAPALGWQGIFWVCGSMTSVFVMLLLFRLPESVRWLVAEEKPASKIVPLLTRFAPGFEFLRFERFHLSGEPETTKSDNPLLKFRELFGGALRLVTPLIWAAFFFSSYAIFLKSAYGVIFMENLGIERQNAAWIESSSAILGSLGGVALLALTEKRGPSWIAFAPIIGIPFFLLVGFGLVLGGPAFIPVLLIGGTFIFVGHLAVISITSIYYPTSVRSTGGGWASFMAKFAAVAAPLLGARFLDGREGAMEGYLVTAACLAGVAVSVLALSWFARRLHDDPHHASAAV